MPSVSINSANFACVISVMVQCLLALASAGSPVAAADLNQARKFLAAGEYEKCRSEAEEGIEETSFTESWYHLKIESELALGRYPEAQATTEAGLRRFPSSIRLRWFAHEVFLFMGDPERARTALDEIQILARRTPWRYTDPANRIVLGRVFLKLGADARQVLEVFFDPIKDASPNELDVYLATGDLALAKDDFALAATEFRKALKLDPTSPDAQFGLARALLPSERGEAMQALERASELNPNHLDTLLLLADAAIDAEQYEEVRQHVRKVLEINPEQPRAWAYLAVLAHLENDAAREEYCRRVALGWYDTNPEIDHTIGRKLSQKYRFREGAAYQRAALEKDAEYLPAQIQLAQDLLRLGREAEGWDLANRVYERDGYNVLAHNLVTLQKNLEKFRTLEQDGLILRMDAHEATVYGQRVLDLLQRCKTRLLEKYGLQLSEPVVVEIFPRQEDFAIRTFGLPGGAGFLGVCFGSVITANSPAALGQTQANWESVLWHEFCHVVTLQKTQNKMPRWFSEGISVYEERQESANWGQRMTPQYRQMVLDGELTPVSDLSSAFLQPPSSLHLQFAYYESSLVIEYLVQEFGHETLRDLLDELGRGLSMNDALQRHIGPLSELDGAFAEFARKRALELAPELDWTPLELPANADLEAIRAFSRAHPANYWSMKREAVELIRRAEFAEARTVLEHLLSVFPDDSGQPNAWALMARIHQESGDADAERAAWQRVAELESDNVEAYGRLAELAAAAEDWDAVVSNAHRLLAVDPLGPEPHRWLVRAAEASGGAATALPAYRALLSMDPVDPAATHFQLAQALVQAGRRDEARREVLKALEFAPRYRDALKLLLELQPAAPEQTTDPVPPKSEQES